MLKVALMSEPATHHPRRWLKPSAALDHFQPPVSLTAGFAVTARSRTRYGFRLGDIGLLIEPNTTSELLDETPVYPLPNTPSWLLGLISLRGNLTPIFDLKPALGLKRDAEHSGRWLLILDQGESAVGCCIDHWPETVMPHRPLDRPPPLPVGLAAYVNTAYHHENQVWLEFDHRGFFHSLAGRLTDPA